MDDEVDIWYRVFETHYAPPLDEFDEPVGTGSIGINIRKFNVIRYTPKGVWLSRPFDSNKFVLRSSRKRFACPTLAEAFESFYARKHKQIRIYQARIRSAERAIYEGQIVERSNPPVAGSF